MFPLPVGSHHPGQLEVGGNQECSIDSSLNSLYSLPFSQLYIWETAVQMGKLQHF